MLMGIMTISVDNEVEFRFREEATRNYTGKGYLGKAVTEAMDRWVEVKRQSRIAEEELTRLRKGFSMGDHLFSSRDELHDR